MRLLVDDRWIGTHGIGRFAAEVIPRLPQYFSMPAWISPTSPIDPFWTSFQIKRMRPDVYFSPGFNAPAKSRSPFIFTIHDLIHLHMDGESSVAKRRYYEWIVRPAIHKAYRVVTVSNFSKGEILEWAGVEPEKVLVAYPGAGSAFTPDGPCHREDRPYVLYVGNRKPHKNIGRMMRAFSATGLAPDVLLLLSGHADGATRRLIQDARVARSAVRFVGNIPDELMAGYYRGAMALLIPSLYEGFGLPALEAMACGTPVLAGHSASLPEVVGEAGLLVDPKDETELADGIRRIVADSYFRETLSAKGLGRAREFSWNLTAKEVTEVLRSAGSESSS